MKNICSYDQFIQMTLEQRQDYLNEIYGDNTPHKILAKVTELSAYSIKIEAMYLIVRDEYAVPFEKIFPDERFASIKKGGYTVDVYCNRRNIFTGNTVICLIGLRDSPDDEGRVFTFRLKDLTKDVSTISKIYSSYDKMIAEKYSELEKRTAEVDAEIDAKKSQAETEIDAKKSELANLQQEISSAQIELANLNDELSKIKKFYGVDDEETVAEKIPDEFHEEKNFDEYISYWQVNLLCTVHYLHYRKEILESVYWGLQTNQLILLTGNPGTGKTSLVRALPNCFGWDDAAIIPVQANWTDKSDLLGYYNPLEKNYMSTPFLDALLKFCRKAEKNPNDIFIICLDEMNLAHVEHYFAEFLSVLQSDRTIRLYSDELRGEIFRELKFNGIIQNENDTEINFDEERFLKMNLDERKYYLQLCRMANMFFKYPAQFEVPTNVKFFGTLNQDATTLDISPKVIDRSFVIRVEKFEWEMDDADVFKRVHDFGKNALNFWQECEYDFETPYLDADELLKSLNFPLSNRITRTMQDFMLSPVATPKNFYDILIASLILPKIRFNAETDEEKISALKNFCKDYPYSNELLEKFMTSPDGKEIDYWRA